MPSFADLTFVLLAVGVPVAMALPLLNGDGDLARHLRVGSIVLEKHALFFRDSLSFTMFGKPFVPYEWLSEVLFAAANRVGGLPAVAILAGLVIAATYALVVAFLRRRGLDPLLALAVGVLAAATSAVHWLARPHLFSSLGSILLIILIDGRPGRRVWLTLPLFVFWVNLHGGYIFGLIVIAIYLAGDVAEGVLGHGVEWQRSARYHGQALLLAGLGTLANPSGLGLYAHVTGYLGDRYLVNHTGEYQSPDFHRTSLQVFLIALLIVVAGLALSRRRPSYPHLLLLLMTTAFALYAARNIELFAVTALPVMALDLEPLWLDLTRWAHRLRLAVAVGEQHSRPGAWALAASVALLLIAATHGTVLGQPVTTARFDPATFPVNAVARARAANLQGHLFNEFSWGGYLLYAWPDQQVFIDGQTDFYGDALTRQYLQVTDLQPGWRTVLASWTISLVLVPTSSALAAQLVREPAWSVWYCDRTAVLLMRDAPAGAAVAPGSCGIQ